MKLLFLIRGWIRLYIWGLCPMCNSDAPKLYDCPICKHYDNLPRYRSQQTKEQIKEVWNKYKKCLL